MRPRCELTFAFGRTDAHQLRRAPSPLSCDRCEIETVTCRVSRRGAQCPFQTPHSDVGAAADRGSEAAERDLLDAPDYDIKQRNSKNAGFEFRWKG